MAASSTEERELALVNKVELRIALTETDGKLSSLLGTYLPPLLLKLASPHVSVRNKVISVCQHINTRLQSPSVEVPVAALLKQFIEQDTKLVKHFDLLYAQQGFKRLGAREKHALVPTLVKGIAGVISDASDQNGATFFNIFLQALHHYDFPRKGGKEDDELRKSLDLSDEDAQALASWFEKLVLLEIGSQATTKGLPGLTEDEKKFLNVYGKPGVWDQAAEGGMGLRATKMLVLKMLSTGAFTDDERFMPALFASAHRDSNIADRGEELLKHAIADVNVEDVSFIRRLYAVYLGSKDRAAAPPPLQIKILAVLQRSSVSAGFTESCLKVIELGLSNDEGGPQGREATKLRSAVFTFANFFFRHGDNLEVKNVAPTVVRKMRGFVENQGWPNPAEDQDLSLRMNAYELIGTCAKAGNIQDIDLLDWLFTSRSEDSSGNDTSFAIEHALAMMIDTFSFIYRAPKDGDDVEMLDGSSASVDDLSQLLLRHVDDGTAAKMEASRKSTRYIAARFANRCLPYSNTIGRYMDVLAAGGGPGEKMEVIEEGKKGLDPYWFSMLNADRKDLWSQDVNAMTPQMAYPAFSDLFKQIFSSSKTLSSWELHEGSVEDVGALFTSFIRRHPSSLLQALKFCWRIFVNEALEADGKPLDIDSEWEQKTEVGSKQNIEIRRAVGNYIRTLKNDARTAFATLVAVTYEAVVSKDGEGVGGCQELLIQMLSVLPRDFIVDFASLMDARRLVPVIGSNDIHKRAAAAQAYGVLVLTGVAGNMVGFIDTIESWIDICDKYPAAIGAQINAINGYLRASAHALSRIHHAALKHSEDFGSLPKRLHEVALSILTDSKDQTLLDAAYTIFEQFSVFGIYGSAIELTAEQTSTIVTHIFQKAEEGKERAMRALGRFGVCISEEDTEDPAVRNLEDKLYKLHEVRDTGAQFTVGEALCCLACGWDNTALQLDMESDLPMPENKKKRTMQRILAQTIQNCKAPKPSLRKASVVWLLCLVQYCGHLREIRDQLRACQAAFGTSLAERDTLVQEAASRGLGIVYEKGDRALRNDLVRDLMQSFSSDKSNLAGNVDEETTLFNPGALRTGEGDSSITTYKDILNLASEIGNPGLVYQFMSLAANNAVWSNRAAFANDGLKKILSDSSTGGYLAENPKLYVKLFRYRFDPNTNVQRSMTDIWNSLVKDSAATLDKYFDPIMTDLLESILGKEWRVRQACCEAISDLVQGRTLEKYEKYLTDIWTKCFQVLDDIKESVRTAAAKLARVLSQILVRNLEQGDSSLKTTEAMLKQVMPFLLSSSGIEASAPDRKIFALVTILDIVKKASAKSFRPFAPQLVERLLALFTELEDGRVNELHMKAAEYKISETKLDEARMSAVRTSPVMEAIDRCFDMLDQETMEQTATSIERVLKTAVGLPSKLACGNAIVSLSLRHRETFRPHAGRFLRLLEKYVLDRNDTAASTYAAASGYLCKLATDKQILHLVDFARKLWLEDENERHRAVSADIIRAVSKQVPDRFSSLASAILPFVFVAKHDGQEDIQEVMTAIWDDNVGSSAISLYLTEVTAMSIDLLDSPRWNLKHSAARSIAAAATALAAGYDGISEDQSRTLWPALSKALEGKTWEGKENVIQGLASFVKAAKGNDFRSSIAADIVKISLREAKRQNSSYRSHALSALAACASAFPAATDWFPQVLDIIEPLLSEQITADSTPASTSTPSSSSASKMEIDSGAGHAAYKAEKRREELVKACLLALQSSISFSASPSPSPSSSPQSPPTPEMQRRLGERIAKFLLLTRQTTKIRARAVESAVFDAVENLFKRRASAPSNTAPLPPEAKESLNLILFPSTAASAAGSLGSGAVESVRLARARAVLAVARGGAAGGVPGFEGLEGEIAGENSEEVRKLLREAVGLL